MKSAWECSQSGCKKPVRDVLVIGWRLFPACKKHLREIGKWTQAERQLMCRKQWDETPKTKVKVIEVRT